MSDIERRLKKLDDVPVNDVMERAKARAEYGAGPPDDLPGSHPRSRVSRLATILVAFAVFAGGGSLLVGTLRGDGSDDPQQPVFEATHPELAIRCHGEEIDVSAPSVALGPQGLHLQLRIDGPATAVRIEGQDVQLVLTGERDEPVSAIPAGEMTVECLVMPEGAVTGGDIASAPVLASAKVEVVDPNGYWAGIQDRQGCGEPLPPAVPTADSDAELVGLLNGPLSVELWNPDTGAERFVSLDTSTGAVRELPSFRDAWDVATSPDGSRVVFTRPDDADGDPTNTDAELEDGEIWIADADGSNAMKLTDNGAEDDLVRWSPDGALLTFRTNRRGPHELYVMNPDGSDQRPLLPDGWDVYSEHEWSPDGARIVFVGSDGVDDRDGCFDDGELAVLDVASGTVTTLTDDEWYESSPTWSPDGSMIVFTASNQSDERHDIMLMNADGSDLRRLTAYSGYDQSPVWSPDGSMIAFTSDRGLPESERPSQAGWLFVMNADGSGVRQLFTPASAGYPEGFHSWAAAWNAPG